MANKAACNGEQRGNFSEGELDGADNETDGGIAQQSSQGTTSLNRSSQTQEEAGALKYC